ncbi:cadherin-related family member 5 isoform X1 [Lepisosteus oculatus]|uniref:cadherin-related family member 5 isoform X1 n=1 Tax=Lepisosteus oculatus TaxID=7918 RepID=UPI00371110E6
MLKILRIFLCQMAINFSCHIVKANLCLGGQDIFAAVKENSPNGEFIANLSIIGDPGANSIRLCLTGDNADWFYLESKTIRLNTSSTRVLDREVQGSVLMASLTCYEDDTIQSVYRIMVEILNENDNRPKFLEHSITTYNISELTAVNTVLFTVQAKDADDDTIMYVIDPAMPDASYFRIDLPNSGRVVLAKPLDYETKAQLQFLIFAVEMNTKQKHNASATIKINVLDGDDQYPQFLPCILLSQDQSRSVCTNPIYTVNITEKEQDITLHFFPGPIHAEDGDKGLRTQLSYAILSGADNGRFQINNVTGEIFMTRPVENRLLTPNLRLRIMAAQVDDPKKYTVATALIRVLAVNQYPPQFNRTTYKGFIIENISPVTFVSTYGNTVLVIQAYDRDFRDGVNPRIHYTLKPKSNNTRLYQITQEGFLIAKTDVLRAFEKHFLEVVATDQESGETVKASIDIEVLQKGQQVPLSPFSGREKLYSMMNMNVLGGSMGVALLLLIFALCVFLRIAKNRRQHQHTADRASVALEKHPNVSLRWFQLVNPGRPMPLVEEISYQNEGYCDLGEEETASNIHGKQGVYVKKEDNINVKTCNKQKEFLKFPKDTVHSHKRPAQESESTSSSIVSNGRTTERSGCKSVWFNDDMIVKEHDSTTNQNPDDSTQEANLQMEKTNSQMANDEPSSQDQSDNGMCEKEKTLAEGSTGEKHDTSESQDDDSLLKDLEEHHDCAEEVLENPYKNMCPAICVMGDKVGTTEDEHSNGTNSNDDLQLEDPETGQTETEAEAFLHCGNPPTHNDETVSSTAENESVTKGSKAQNLDYDSTTQTGLLFFVEDSIEF